MATQYIPVREFSRVSMQLTQARKNLEEARGLLGDALGLPKNNLYCRIEAFLERTK